MAENKSNNDRKRKKERFPNLSYGTISSKKVESILGLAKLTTHCFYVNIYTNTLYSSLSFYEKRNNLKNLFAISHWHIYPNLKQKYDILGNMINTFLAVRYCKSCNLPPSYPSVKLARLMLAVG